MSLVETVNCPVHGKATIAYLGEFTVTADCGHTFRDGRIVDRLLTTPDGDGPHYGGRGSVHFISYRPCEWGIVSHCVCGWHSAIPVDESPDYDDALEQALQHLVVSR